MTPQGDIRDIKHVVILMQENRSFDHYFGSLRGVRGFGDRATIHAAGGRAALWRDRPQLGDAARRVARRADGRLAARQGRAHHDGLPDARRHPDELGRFLPWQSYPETLQAAGVSWKVYQGSDNDGDNGAQYFAAIASVDPAQGGTAAPGDVYYDNPAGSPDDGAYFTGQVLRALNADPGVFNSTLVIIDYDENDGQFDHVPPPVPAAGTAGEFHLEGALAPVPLPVGLGFRVPLLLISPWTRGGWVTSEVSDHTSVIQFIERWTAALGNPAICPHISAWRRSVCGDLTGAFDFANPVDGLPDLPFVTAPSGGIREYHPAPASDVMPVQEPGTKRARPLPCQPGTSLAGFTADGGAVTARLALSNNAPFVCRASHFAVYDITVTGPNRFLRRFTGDRGAPGATAHVTASYYRPGRGPTLTLTLANRGTAGVTFMVSACAYTSTSRSTATVPGHSGSPVTWRPARPA